MIQLLTSIINKRSSNVVNQPVKTTEPITSYSRNMPYQNSNYSDKNVIENKQEIYNRQFNERQKEYETMNAKPLPPAEVNFTEVIKDEPISNMEELIRNHTREREQELQIYVPNPIQPQMASQTKTLNIKSTENIKLEIDTILPTLDTIEKPKKSVSWSTNDENNDMNFLKTHIFEMTKQIMNLQNDVSKIIQNLDIIKNKKNNEENAEYII